MSDDNNNIKNVIDGIFKSSGRLSTGYNQFTIEEVWRSTFGDLISSYTTRVIYNNEILTIYINSSPLKEEILINKTSVLEKLNANLEYRKVKDLIVR